VPNPNLKPEKSRNVEFGVRGRLDQLSFDTAVFYGRFKDLIQDGATSAAPSATRPIPP
jgi:hemoglobin/transferrin/lactoferrin receptor protein